MSTDDVTEEYAEPGGGGDGSLHLSNSLNEAIYAQAVPLPPRNSGRKDNRLPPLPLSHYARPCTPPHEGYVHSNPAASEAILVKSLSKTEVRHYRYAATPTNSSSTSSSLSNSPFRMAPIGGNGNSHRRFSKSTLKKKAELATTTQALDAELYAQIEKTNGAETTTFKPFKRSNSIDLDHQPLNKFRLADLTVVEKLGEGQFGEIHLCKTEQNERVAVKFLRRDCDPVTKSDFQHEARILTGLNDPNLVRVLGVCYDEDEVCAHHMFLRILKFLFEIVLSRESWLLD